MTRASANSAIAREAGVVRRLPGRPRDDSLRARRCEQILKKATAVFAKHGYADTDVQWIADPLRISKGTVYRYFSSKEELFLAAVQRGVMGLERHIDAAVIGAAGPLEKIGAAVRAYLEFFDKHPALIELFIQERAEFRDRRKPIYFEHGCKGQEEFRSVLEGLVRAGRVRDVAVDRIQTVIGDTLFGTILTNHFSGRGRSFEEQAAAVVDVVFRGILSESERRKRDEPRRHEGTKK